MTRAYTIVGFQEFFKREDGKIVFTTIMQNDFNLSGAMGKIAAAAALNQIPKSLKAWFNALTNHVQQFTMSL